LNGLKCGFVSLPVTKHLPRVVLHNHCSPSKDDLEPSIAANSLTLAEERLPLAEGWTPSTSSINGISLNVLVAKLAWATDSKFTSKATADAMLGSEKEL
jgi:hypothetical protein